MSTPEDTPESPWQVEIGEHVHARFVDMNQAVRVAKHLSFSRGIEVRITRGALEEFRYLHGDAQYSRIANEQAMQAAADRDAAPCDPASFIRMDEVDLVRELRNAAERAREAGAGESFAAYITSIIATA